MEPVTVGTPAERKASLEGWVAALTRFAGQERPTASGYQADAIIVSGLHSAISNEAGLLIPDLRAGESTSDRPAQEVFRSAQIANRVAGTFFSQAADAVIASRDRKDEVF
jgi:hypothetical protein